MNRAADRVEIPQPDNGGPEEQAAQWLAYLYSGVVTEEGRGAFRHWLSRSEENARAYRATQQIWHDMAVPGAEGFWQEQPALQPMPSGQVRRRGLLAGAAAIAAAILIGIGFWGLQIYPAANTVEYASGVSEIKTVNLPDGSRITLDAGSTLRGQFSRDQRAVELLRGGAYFDVVADPTKTFRVRVAGAEIHVVGTEFDVGYRSKDVRIAVTEGVVTVNGALPGGQAEPEKPIQLEAGEEVIASLSGALGDIRGFDLRRAAPWREGRLVYRDARLEDVVAAVNRYRRQKIVLADEALGDILVTMALRIEDTDNLLTGLEATSPVVIDRLPEGIVIRPKSDAGRKTGGTSQ